MRIIIIIITIIITYLLTAIEFSLGGVVLTLMMMMIIIIIIIIIVAFVISAWNSFWNDEIEILRLVNLNNVCFETLAHYASCTYAVGLYDVSDM